MYKIVPSDKLTALLDLVEELLAAGERLHADDVHFLDECSNCKLMADARTSLEWWDAIEERSNQAEDDILYLAETAKEVLDVVDRLEDALDIFLPPASRLREAIALVNEAFPAERQGQYEERG